MKRLFRYLLITACFLIALVVNCAGIESRELKEIESIKKVFAQLSRGMVQGDLKSIYPILSANFKKLQNYKEFVEEYTDNRDKLIDRFKSSFLKRVAVEDTIASAWVVWGTGNKGLLIFIKEGDTWKLEGKGEKSYP